MAYGVPPALAAIGAILVLRPVLPAVRPFRSGGICLFLGRGAVARRPRRRLDRRGRSRRTPSGSSATFGVDLLAVFLFIAAVLLLTGASIAGVLKATSDTMADTTRALRTAAPKRARAAGAARRASAEGRRPARARGQRADRSTAADAPVWEPLPEPSPPRSPSSPSCSSRPPRSPRPRTSRRPRRSPPPRRRSRSARGRPDAAGPLPRLDHRRPRVPVARPVADSCCSARAPSRPSPTPPARPRPRRTSSRRSATSASRRRSSARPPARTSPATSCASRPASR